MPVERIKTRRGYRTRAYCKCGWHGRYREYPNRLNLHAEEDYERHWVRRHQAAEQSLQAELGKEG